MGPVDAVAQSPQDFLGLVGLGEIVVASRAQPPNALIHLAERAQDDHGRLPAHAAYALDDTEAIELGEHAIDDHRVVVLAGGEGRRLWPLTAERAKPAVPFGGTFRIIDFVLSNLVRISRSSDILGVLDRNKFLALMPMTTEKNSKAAMRRILKGIHDVAYSIEETSVVIKLAGAVTTFDKDRTPTLNDFVKRAESDIFDMVNRLRNIQSIY